MANKLRISHLPVNQAWVLTLGDQIVRVEASNLFWSTRKELVEALEQRGLKVEKSGIVKVDRSKPNSERKFAAALTGTHTDQVEQLRSPR